VLWDGGIVRTYSFLFLVLSCLRSCSCGATRDGNTGCCGGLLGSVFRGGIGGHGGQAVGGGGGCSRFAPFIAFAGVTLVFSLLFRMWAPLMVAYFCHPMFPVHEGRGGRRAKSRSRSCGLRLSSPSWGARWALICFGLGFAQVGGSRRAALWGALWLGWRLGSVHAV
jgi:hypothetical protein